MHYRENAVGVKDKRASTSRVLETKRRMRSAAIYKIRLRRTEGQTTKGMHAHARHATYESKQVVTCDIMLRVPFFDNQL